MNNNKFSVSKTSVFMTSLGLKNAKSLAKSEQKYIKQGLDKHLPIKKLIKPYRRFLIAINSVDFFSKKLKSYKLPKKECKKTLHEIYQIRDKNLASINSACKILKNRFNVYSYEAGFAFGAGGALANLDKLEDLTEEYCKKVLEEFESIASLEVDKIKVGKNQKE